MNQVFNIYFHSDQDYQAQCCKHSKGIINSFEPMAWCWTLVWTMTTKWSGFPHLLCNPKLKFGVLNFKKQEIQENIMSRSVENVDKWERQIRYSRRPFTQKKKIEKWNIWFNTSLVNDEFTHLTYTNSQVSKT